jgi:hypothetical protein
MISLFNELLAKSSSRNRDDSTHLIQPRPKYRKEQYLSASTANVGLCVNPDLSLVDAGHIYLFIQTSIYSSISSM